MGWAMKMSTWFLALRPTDHRATARPSSRRSTRSSRGACPAAPPADIVGNFPESVDGSNGHRHSNLRVLLSGPRRTASRRARAGTDDRVLGSRIPSVESPLGRRRGPRARLLVGHQVAGRPARSASSWTPRSSSPSTASRTGSSRPASRSALRTSSCSRSRPRPCSSRSAKRRGRRRSRLRQGRHRLLAEGRQRQDRRRDEPRGGRGALRPPTLLVDLDLQFGDSALTLGVAPARDDRRPATSAGDIDAEKLPAFVATDPRAGFPCFRRRSAPRRPTSSARRSSPRCSTPPAAPYDAVVVDTGPLFDGAMLAALDYTDQLLLVCNPEVTSLKNVRIGLETIDRLGFDRERVSLVANRIGAAGGVGRKDIESALDTRSRIELPDDSESHRGQPRRCRSLSRTRRARSRGRSSSSSPSVFAPAHPRRRQRRERRVLLRGRR